MSEEPAPGQWTVEPETPKPDVHFTIGRWTFSLRASVHFVFGFGLWLGFFWLLDIAVGHENLQRLYDIQTRWIESLSRLNPLALVSSFLDHMNNAGAAHPDDYGNMQGGVPFYFWPIAGLWSLVSDLLGRGAIVTLTQLGLGVLAVTTFNTVTSNGQRAFFGELNKDGRTLENLIFWPLAVVGVASGLAFVLQWLMLGALYLFSWVTGLAATAAAATGVMGFCWFCFKKLGEKGVEHVVTKNA